MSALPEGRYQGIVLSSTPSPKHRLHTIHARLLNGEQIEVVMYGGLNREHAILLALARLRFNGVGQPWLPDPDRTVPLPVLNMDLSFEQKYPDRNRVLRVKRTGEFLPCDVRFVQGRMDWAEF